MRTIGTLAEKIHNLLKYSLWQIPALIALACLIAIVTNHFLPDGMPLVGVWAADERISDTKDESLVITLELMRGLCLVCGFWLPGATVTSTGLLTAFIGALAFNQSRGLNVHCGCFSTQSLDGPAGSWTVARNLSFLTVSAYLTVLVFFYRLPNKKTTEPAQQP